jgi:hypothetical protein
MVPNLPLSPYSEECARAPYLFLIVAEVLNSVVKIKTIAGRIKGIKLPVDDR